MTPRTAPCQAPLPMGFSRQEYWSGLPHPSMGDLPDLGIEPLLRRLHWQAGSLPLVPPGKPQWNYTTSWIFTYNHNFIFQINYLTPYLNQVQPFSFEAFYFSKWQITHVIWGLNTVQSSWKWLHQSEFKLKNRNPGVICILTGDLYRDLTGPHRDRL